MKKHITNVGALHIGFGVIGILIALITVVILVGTGILVLMIEGDDVPLTVMGSISVFIILIFAVLSIPEIIGGIGLLKYKNWARYLVLILSVLNLFNVPVGTAVGIYSIWVLMQDETDELFTPELSE